MNYFFFLLDFFCFFFFLALTFYSSFLFMWIYNVEVYFYLLYRNLINHHSALCKWKIRYSVSNEFTLFCMQTTHIVINHGLKLLKLLFLFIRRPCFRSKKAIRRLHIARRKWASIDHEMQLHNIQSWVK